jgi:group I intron endonuclease
MSLSGIYCYIDSKDNSVVYVGKDSNIHKNKRHHDHNQPCQYDRQHINKVLQNNPDRYHYKILSVFNPEDEPEDLLNELEMSFIRQFKAIFNFTEGGEGSTGFKHSDEAKQKISEANKGRLKGVKRGPFTDEHKKKLSLNHADVNGSNNPAYVEYARIVKAGFVKGKQRYMIKRNGKKIKFSIDYPSLVEWFKENYPNEYLNFKEDY